MRKIVFYCNTRTAMPTLNLNQVTLCCVDTLNHDLALAAICRSMRECEFGRVLFFTDRALELEGIDVVRIAPITSRDAYSRYVIKELGRHIDTEFALMMQWDGFVLNPRAWDDAFLDCDYVGARWSWHTDGHTVGNGGFCLRSKRLLNALADPHIAEFPIEDEAICRTYRTYLETTHRIRFASDAVADRFAFETSYAKQLPFGFHGLFNFGLVFKSADLAVFLGMASPAILGSVQCMRLAYSLTANKRPDDAAMVLRKILGAHPMHTEAAALLKRLGITAAATLVTPTVKVVGRNDPCPCGSGKRYKACHGMLG